MLGTALARLYESVGFHKRETSVLRFTPATD
jgi:hypothetical protein